MCAEWEQNSTFVPAVRGDISAGILMDFFVLALGRTVHGCVSHFDMVGCVWKPHGSTKLVCKSSFLVTFKIGT